MYKSITLRAKASLSAGNGAAVERRGKALGIVVDRTKAVPMKELTDRTFFSGTPSSSDPARFQTADF